MINPIYQPSGAAREYGEWALNIFGGCPHRCHYCYVPGVLHKSPEEFYGHVEPRPGIIEATEKQLKKGGFEGKTIHLCFTGDPYPIGTDTTATREIIKLIKGAGANVQILTKGGNAALRDFDLLGPDDLFGVTLTCLNDIARLSEPGAAKPTERIDTLLEASKRGIKTWISFEPVLCTYEVLQMIDTIPTLFEDERTRPFLKIGKLNHRKNGTDWAAFGREAERICKENGWKYYIKDDLRKEMNRAGVK